MDLISRQAAIEQAEKKSQVEGAYGYMDTKSIVDMLEDLPAAESERKKGRWIDTEPNVPDASYKKSGMAYYCSCCKHLAGKYKHKTYRFCPWCGAEMT